MPVGWQVEMHRERSVRWTQTFEALEGRDDRLWQREVAELAFKAEQSMAEQWRRVLRHAEDGARRAASGV